MKRKEAPEADTARLDADTELAEAVRLLKEAVQRAENVLEQVRKESLP